VDLQSKLTALMELAERLGIDVRRVPLGGEGGGICTLQGREVLFLDSSADLATQWARSLAGLAQLPEIDKVYVIPELREEIDAVRGEG